MNNSEVISMDIYDEIIDSAACPIADDLGTPKTKDEMEWAVRNNYIIPAFKSGEITVDRLLDHADVRLDWYVPSVEAIEFFNFFRMVLGEEPENANPKAHYFLIDCLFGQENVLPYFSVRNIQYADLKNRIVVLASREFSKSTLIGTMIPLYLAWKGRLPNIGAVQFALYVSDSMRNNVKTTMETIGSVYRESVFLLNEFEDATTNQDEISFTRKPRTRGEIELYREFVERQGKKPSEVPGRMKRTFTMRGFGASSGGRGSRDALARPKLVLFDDLVSSEADSTSEVILENIESTIEADILPALHGTNNMAILIGTPYNKRDPVYWRIESGMWLPIVFPKAEKISIDLKPEEFRGVWEDRHTYEACMRDYRRAWRSKESGNPMPMRKLMQEYYLRISSEEDRMIPDSLIQWYSRNDIIKNAWKYNWYMTTDFTSTGNAGSDLSGIALWAVGWDGDWFLVDLSLRKLSLEEQYDKVFDMARYTLNHVRSLEVGVEIDGQQNIHLYSLRERMPKENVFFSFARQKGAKGRQEGIRSRLEGGSKHWRFRMTLPLFENHKIWFPKELKESPDMRELMEEIRYATFDSFGSAHDDGADLISMINMIDVVLPVRDDSLKNPEHKNDPYYERLWGRTSDDDDENSAYDSYV